MPSSAQTLGLDVFTRLSHGCLGRGDVGGILLEVQGGERDAMSEAAGRDPHVVDRPWPPALDGCRGQSAPGGGDRLVSGQYRNAGQPTGEFLAATLAPVADLRPLGQLSEGHNGEQRVRGGASGSSGRT
jgi:hypothetical protein